MSATEKKPQWKIVFNPAAAQYLSRQASERDMALFLTNKIDDALGEEGSAWHRTRSSVHVVDVVPEGSEIDRKGLACKVVFNDSALRFILPRVHEFQTEPQFIHRVLSECLDSESPQWGNSGCKIESVEPALGR